MKFKKKPVVIETEVYLEGQPLPFQNEGVCIPVADYHYIKTLEGDMRISDGDWVIKGVFGEFYPCKPDIFVKTYEKVDD